MSSSVGFIRFFREYIALGDSVSIDLYPALDAGEIDVAVNLERNPNAGAVAPLGAASLLYSNDQTLWPIEQGDDLVSRYPGLTYRNLASDGATIGDVFGEQLPQIEPSEGATVITLSIGGNDLLSAFANKPRATLLDAIVRDVGEAYDFLVDALRSARPNALILLTTVYDPSDRMARIPGVLEDAGKLPLHILDQFNQRLRTLAAGTRGVIIADVYAHFLGHGASVPEEERWYWRRSQMEPNAQGANEIRRVWFDAIEDADFKEQGFYD